MQNVLICLKKNVLYIFLSVVYLQSFAGLRWQSEKISDHQVNLYFQCDNPVIVEEQSQLFLLQNTLHVFVFSSSKDIQIKELARN